MKTEKCYLLTHTLSHHLSALKRAGLRIPDESFIEKVEISIEDVIKELFAQSSEKVHVHGFRFADFCDEIIASTKVLQGQFPEAVVVSTTPLITYDAHSGACLALNRLVDLDGNSLPIGARPHHPPINRQFDSVSSMIQSKQVIIVDDGAFTGATLELIITELEKRKVKVVAVVLGILFPEAKKRLEKLGCTPNHTVSRENIIDWMPTHDFIPFVPNCGKVVGQKIYDFHSPIHLFNGCTMSIPYIDPYGDLRKWAGLDIRPIDLSNFSKFCITKAIELFSEIDRLNGRWLQIGDLMHTSPEVSVPVSCGRSLARRDVRMLSESVVEILSADYMFLT